MSEWRSQSVARRLWATLIMLAALLTTTAGAAHPPEEDAIRLGILSLAPPAKILRQWQAFADYIGTKTGHPVEIVVPRGFARISQAVIDKRIDLFYVNSHIYYRLRQKGQAIAIAQMRNLDGKTTSSSVILVRGDSPFQSLEQLKGQSVAFVSPMGAGGYLAPRALFYAKGIETPTGLEEQFTKNLSSSLHKLILGDVQAATMCGLNYQLMSQRLDTGELRILARSDEYPENVLAVRPGLPPELTDHLTQTIVGMVDDPQGRRILDGMRGMKIQCFASYDPEAETQTRRLLKLGQF